MCVYDRIRDLTDLGTHDERTPTCVKASFAYPWDLQDEGIEKALETMTGRCACNAIALTPSYHSARIFGRGSRPPRSIRAPARRRFSFRSRSITKPARRCPS